MEEHGHHHDHEEDETVCVTVGVFFIAVLAAIICIALI